MPAPAPYEKQFVFYAFSRDEVEAGDFTRLLNSFDPNRLPQDKLASLMGKMIFSVDGYDDCPEEIYAIPSVRAFYQALHSKWPFWLYFCALEADFLMMMVLCCLENVTAASSPDWQGSASHVDLGELLQFIDADFTHMNSVCEKAGLSERAIYDRTKAVLEYFPFDVSDQ